MRTETFSGLLEKQLDKQRTRQAKNARAVAEAMREIEARKLAQGEAPPDFSQGISLSDLAS